MHTETSSYLTQLIQYNDNSGRPIVLTILSKYALLAIARLHHAVTVPDGLCRSQAILGLHAIAIYG